MQICMCPRGIASGGRSAECDSYICMYGYMDPDGNAKKERPEEVECVREMDRLEGERIGERVHTCYPNVKKKMNKTRNRKRHRMEKKNQSGAKTCPALNKFLCVILTPV